MKPLVATIVLAAGLWAVMFSPWTSPCLNFWWMMTASALVLSILATVCRPRWWKAERWDASQLLAGVAMAVALWGVFWLGDRLSGLWFDFARPQVNLIYGMKGGESPWLLSFLLLFLIGPAEEIFWRGYVQRTLAARWGSNAALVAATLVYALVHVPSCNFMLVMAALVAGAFWGILFRFFPHRFPAIVLSHALWDAAVFVWFPL